MHTRHPEQMRPACLALVYAQFHVQLSAPPEPHDRVIEAAGAAGAAGTPKRSEMAGTVQTAGIAATTATVEVVEMAGVLEGREMDGTTGTEEAPRTAGLVGADEPPASDFAVFATDD